MSCFFRQIALFFFLLVIVAAGSAMEISVRGGQVIATGPIDAIDEPRLALALAAPDVRELVLMNSQGGDAMAALAMGRIVAQRRIRTVVVGTCAGACPIVFLGGVERRFAEGQHPRVTLLGLDGAYNPPLTSDLSERILAFVMGRLGAGIDTPLLLEPLVRSNQTGGSVLLREMERNTTFDITAYRCAGGADAKCSALAGKDAFTLGMVTNRATLKELLPADLLPVEMFFGFELQSDSNDVSQALLAQGQAMCGDDALCNERFGVAVPRFQAQKSFRAAALGVGRRGFGFSDDQENANLAAKRAIYLCNHTLGNKKLCSLAVVDNFDTASLYLQSAQQTAAILAQLTLPTGTAWAGEDIGSPVVAAASFRRKSLLEATPLLVSGVQTWRTVDLARAIKERRVTSIDVYGVAAQMLPGAVHFWDGGLAFDDEVIDRAYDQRFRDMLQIVEPDKDSAVVFYCQDNACWQAINSALRASRAGYLRAGWYRGGLRAWAQAGLPLVQKVPSVVLY